MVTSDACMHAGAAQGSRQLSVMYALTHIIFQRVFELTRGRVRLRASGRT